jgi:hypothetical protein
MAMREEKDAVRLFLLWTRNNSTGLFGAGPDGGNVPTMRPYTREQAVDAFIKSHAADYPRLLKHREFIVRNAQPEMASFGMTVRTIPLPAGEVPEQFRQAE